METSRRDEFEEPRVVWTEHVARWLRTNTVLGRLYTVVARRLVPLLFAVGIAAPVGLLLLLCFLPKFVRNAQRRRRYGVRLVTEPIERIASEPGPSD